MYEIQNKTKSLLVFDLPSKLNVWNIQRILGQTYVIHYLF